MGITLADCTVYDVEVFPNYLLFMFKAPKSCTYVTHQNLQALSASVHSKTILVGYNNFNYDDVLLRFALQHPEAKPANFYKLSKQIIEGRETSADLNFRLRYAKAPWKLSIDLFQLLNKRGTLKEWGCREGCEHVRESPFHWDSPVAAKDEAAVRAYCTNDIVITQKLLEKHFHLVTLRTELANSHELPLKPLLYASEPGVAQTAFWHFHKTRTGSNPSQGREAAAMHEDNRQRAWPLAEIISPRVRFQTAAFKALLRRLQGGSVIARDPRGTRWDLQEDLQGPVELAGCEFQLGTGGLHSLDAPGRFEGPLYDIDVTSYYPSIIIEEGIYPAHMGPAFVEDMRRVRDQRVALKKAGNKPAADALKIVINSVFGKLNDPYSPLRSVPSALRVTINGQLMLLMLIEALWLAGCDILSANTDGVTVRQRGKTAKHNSAMTAWSKATGHALELTEFTRYCRRDVNCYVAGKKDGSVKAKGAFEMHPITPGAKWDGLVIKKAAQEFLLHGTPIAATVHAAKYYDFLFYQSVKNGGSLRCGTLLPPRTRIARWYVATKGQRLERINPNETLCKLPHGDCVRLAQDIPHLEVMGLDHVDYQYYINAAEELAASTDSTL